MLRRINFRLFFALLLVGLVPTVYTTFRVFLLGQLPGEWSFSIAGQLSWVNLLYEVLNEAIILPLFFFLGNIRQDHDAFSNRVRTGLVMCFAVYAVLSAFIIALTRPLLVAMAADDALIDPSVPYIRLEAIANLFSILAQFSLVALVTLNKRSYLYALTLVRLVLCLGFDAFFASALPFSLKLGVNGIALSNILVNALLFVISIGLLARENVAVFRCAKLDFTWCKVLLRVGGVSGAESLVRNLAYMLMIARMVNMVNEQGTYWVANNFIWGWLLLPVLQLGELIKQEVAANPENVQKNTPGYLLDHRRYFGALGGHDPPLEAIYGRSSWVFRCR